MALVVKMELPADVRYLRVVTACVAELLAARKREGTPTEASHDILLAVQEACMNIVEHAYEDDADGRFSLALTASDEGFVAEFVDTGRAFDPTAVPDPDLDNGQVHGYGLFLMKSLLDNVTYTSEDGENRWRLVKRLP
jgi:serine/threonine-protein kinase RsbW